jgi:molecular chaperone DnaK (HSP70)
MADIYDSILQGIKEEEGLSDSGLITRLKQLQPSVKELRNAYRNYPVHVSYNKIDIQASYLITYFPHYYQLIYKILLEDFPSIFDGKKRVKLIYFGGGPGPEIYGTIKYIKNNRPDVKIVDVILFDINAKQWEYSHKILEKYLLQAILKSGLRVNLMFNHFDLTQAFDTKINNDHIANCDLIVFQNCLNEIPILSTGQLKKNFQQIYNLMPDGCSILLADLTGGNLSVTALMQDIERQISFIDSPITHHSIIENAACETIQSVHHIPSSIIRQHLLDGQNNLIPRKWLKYNYSFLQKSQCLRSHEINIENGLQAIYTPLNFVNSDANNYLNEKTFIGIDFGTSTTVVSLARVIDGAISTETIPITQKDEHGGCCYRPLINSAIALKDSHLLFGFYAYELKSELKRNVDIWHSFKMELGLDNNMQYPKSVLYTDPDYPVKNSLDIITLFFKYLKSEIDQFIAKNQLPEKTEFAVSIPASFLESERMDLLRCLEEAKITVGNNPFIDEPIAAVLNYLFENTNGSILENKKNIMVIDCGAGTCDISILEIGKTSKGAYAKNLSISRFGKIGGQQLDRLIAEKVLWDQFCSCNKSMQNSTGAEKESTIAILSEIGEKLKLKLCKNVDVIDVLHYQLPEKAITFEKVWIPDETVKSQDGNFFSFPKPSITYHQFYDIMREYVSFHIMKNIASNTINHSVQSALHKSNILKSDISNIIVTGGSMKNPYLLSFIANYFEASSIIRPDNIQEHVSKGAAIHSLALNTFGVNLIRPILSDNLYIKNKNDQLILFTAGTEIPSIDKRIQIAPIVASQKFIEIPVFNSTILTPLKTFIFPCIYGAKYQVLFFITPEKWIDCEVTANGNEIVHKVNFQSIANDLYSFSALAIN